MENKDDEPKSDASEEGKEDFQQLYLEQKKNAEEYLTRLKYMQADFENFKKRVAKEKMETIMIATEAVMEDVLPVLDEFEQAIVHFPEGDGKKGVEMIFANLSKSLKMHGLSQIPLKSGDLFDPDLHEAVGEEKTADEKLKGKVAKIVQKGYMLNGIVMRFAKVMVFTKE
ncbi:nucleotide exchange factor GrpE [Candidatus Micrarchaeota archaeon]|nr:nucleotide exchange factor GrpE [Candidatus Micrarchaeota archaeon]